MCVSMCVSVSVCVYVRPIVFRLPKSQCLFPVIGTLIAGNET